jgi:hypothetical protein
LHRDSALGMGPTLVATKKHFLPGVALSKKILDFGLGRLKSCCRNAADAAGVLRCVVVDPKEEAE